MVHLQAKHTLATKVQQLEKILRFLPRVPATLESWMYVAIQGRNGG
jgi:hypothetical protein